MSADAQHDAQTEMNPAARPRRRWFQYSMSSLLLLMLACAAGLALVVNPAREQRRAVEFVESLGGQVTYAEPDDTAWVRAPEWLLQLVGTDYFLSVVEVDLSGTQVSDTGLRQLKGMVALDTLDLSDTEVSDAVLIHLDELTTLKYLDLDGTKITYAGWRELEQELPNCLIIPDFD